MKPRNVIANMFGYEIISKKKSHALFEGHLYQILKKYAINCVLDIGANQGQYGRLLREMGYKGYIFSFEPVWKSFDILEENCAGDPLWKAYNLAIGSEKGMKTINVSGSSDLSSFLSPNEFFSRTFLDRENTRIQQTEEVQMENLDSVYEEIVSSVEKPCVLLKTDTQGYDLEVIKGVKKNISNITVLQSEVASIPLYDGMPDYLEVLGKYRELGFEITGMFPVSREKKDLRVIEFDCIFVRKAI